MCHQSVERAGAVLREIAVHEDDEPIWCQALVGVLKNLPGDRADVAKHDDVIAKGQPSANVSGRCFDALRQTRTADVPGGNFTYRSDVENAGMKAGIFP